MTQAMVDAVKEGRMDRPESSPHREEPKSLETEMQEFLDSLPDLSPASMDFALDSSEAMDVASVPLNEIPEDLRDLFTPEVGGVEGELLGQLPPGTRAPPPTPEDAVPEMTIPAPTSAEMPTIPPLRLYIPPVATETSEMGPPEEPLMKATPSVLSKGQKRRMKRQTRITEAKMQLAKIQLQLDRLERRVMFPATDFSTRDHLLPSLNMTSLSGM